MLTQYSRTGLLLGESGMDLLRRSRVAVFGIGGVGGYVCEALVRSGVGAFDLIDKCIEQYIREEYKKYDPHTTFIAYGADTEPSVLADDDESYVNWLNEKGLRPNEYYLVVGRFVLQTKMGREGTNACSLTAHFLCRCLR